MTEAGPPEESETDGAMKTPPVLRNQHAFGRTLFPAAALLLFGAAPAAARPGTEIYLAPLGHEDGGGWSIGEPVNITNRPGVDDQPSFTPDGSALLFASIRDDQADVYRYDLGTGRVRQVTRTPESEYLPVVMPDGSGFSAIRVERDGKKRLWRFSMTGDGARVMFPEVEPVGTYAWGDEHTVAMFVPGSPPTLRMASTVWGKPAVIAYDVGPCLQKVPGRDQMSFTETVSTGSWIRLIELMTRRTSTRLRTLGNGQDYAWLPDGNTLIMAEGSVIHEADDRRVWEPVADLSGFGLRDITWIAVSPRGDRLALVASESASR